MAEVEKAVMATTTASDIPAAENSEAGCGSAELGTSPTQERSSNSHPHDSEYDTASDLEGGEEYDDDEDDMDDDNDDDDGSITDEDDEDGSITDDDERPLVAGGIGIEKVDVEAQKKVDEDRSNPQYIPKRGTFYEHDDRTAEGEVEGSVTVGEVGEHLEGSGGAAGPKTPQSPTISQASKTMKKWQPASAVERWSHDRFDESEQAPKSRSELVSSYGYDIRTEDAPPRARRRRRYGRGPTKYSRNWEDENAYLKTSNKERKPLRPSDFPALSERGERGDRVERGERVERSERVERGSKTHKSAHGTREEKENRMSRRPVGEGTSGSAGEKLSNNQRQNDDHREPRVDGKSNKQKNYGRQSAPVGRQAAMEFKQKQRNGGQFNSSAPTGSNMQNNRAEQFNDRQSGRSHNNQSSGTVNDHQKSSGKVQTHAKHANMPSQNDMYNSNSNNSRVHEHTANYQQQTQQQVQSPQQPAMAMRQPLPNKTTPTSNLSQRLQQVQHRNDPSHVGSVQMHALATQNQMINQQQPPQTTNLVMSPPQQQQQQHQQPPLPANQAQPLPPQEQRGPPKRYSSLRRSQHEAQHIADQHQLQQLHLQQQQQQPPLMLQDQHMLQAAMLYHQENIQAQMQALQVGTAPAAPKQPTYPTTQGAPPQTYGTAAGAASAPPAAYYVAAPEAYAVAATAAANAQAAQSTQYAPPQPPNYMPQAPNTAVAAAAASLAYTSAASPAQQAVPGPVPAAYVPPAAVQTGGPAGPAPQPAPPNANQNYSNYQNYNTVGGTTYFVPPPAQTATRPVVLPQRRPTNAIPILPPSEKNKQRPAGAVDIKEETKGSTAVAGSATQSNAPIGSAENIDHIIDNMFVQRPAFQPPAFQSPIPAARKSSTPPSGDTNTISNPSDLNTTAPTAEPEPDGAIAKGASNADQIEDGAPASAAAENSSNSSAVAAPAQE